MVWQAAIAIFSVATLVGCGSPKEEQPADPALTFSKDPTVTYSIPSTDGYLIRGAETRVKLDMWMTTLDQVRMASPACIVTKTADGSNEVVVRYMGYPSDNDTATFHVQIVNNFDSIAFRDTWRIPVKSE